MKKKAKKCLKFKTYDNDLSVSYLELADHPHQLVRGIVKKTVGIHELIPGYDGPRLNLEFDENGTAIGIEIIYPYEEFYDEEEDYDVE